MLNNLVKRSFRRLKVQPNLLKRTPLRTPLYPRHFTGGFNISRNFSKKIDDFVENKADQPKAPTENPDAFDPFQEDENAFYNSKKNGIYFFTAAGITLAGLYFIMQVNKVRGDRKESKKLSVSHVGRANIGGHWRLRDVNGNPFGSDDLEGKYYLIYFGFCRCPDVCPQSLYKLTKALKIIKGLPEKKYFDLKTIFVTVDPDRDDKEAIHNFLKHFDKDILAVTGTSNNDPALRDAMDKFKIYASKIELEDDNTKPGEPVPYTLDHTIITYLMDDQSQYLTHIGSNASAGDIAQLIVNKVMMNERDKLLR